MIALWVEKKALRTIRLMCLEPHLATGQLTRPAVSAGPAVGRSV
jgi:hypothetical protein